MKRVFCVVIAVLLTGCLAGSPGSARVGPTLAPPPEGDTPVPLPISGAVVAEPQFTYFQMLTETDGWGLTENAVLRTNDGGTTWHNVSPPRVPTLGYGAGSSFPDSNRAFVVAPDDSNPMRAGTLYKTADGGLTWASNAIPFGSCLLQFLDGVSGWAMVGLGVAAGSNAIAIMRTTNGGETWEQTFINDPTVQGSSDEIPLGGLKGAFAALDMQTAWVGGVIYSPATVYLYRTGDGGQHWSHVALEVPAGSENAQLSIDQIRFLSANDGFLSMQISGGTSERAVYTTRDAGKTWTLVSALIPKGRSVDFVSAAEGVVFDGDRFQVTHDAGQSWEAVEPDLVFSESFMNMDFVNSMTGWVLTSDPTTFRIGVYKTTDGGRSWIPQ